MTVGVHRVFDTLVERKESRLTSSAIALSLKPFRYPPQSEPSTSPELEQRLSRIPIRPVLFLRICYRLTGETVFQFHCHQWQTVEEQPHIYRLFVPSLNTSTAELERIGSDRRVFGGRGSYRLMDGSRSG